jgi:hypothetical protein
MLFKKKTCICIYTLFLKKPEQTLSDFMKEIFGVMMAPLHTYRSKVLLQ